MQIFLKLFQNIEQGPLSNLCLQGQHNCDTKPDKDTARKNYIDQYPLWTFFHLPTSSFYEIFTCDIYISKFIAFNTISILLRITVPS